MYGSSFIIVTRRPRASRIAARDAAAIPLPSEDTTPPVTKMSGVTGLAGDMAAAARWKAPFYSMSRHAFPACRETARSPASPATVPRRLDLLRVAVRLLGLRGIGLGALGRGGIGGRRFVAAHRP